MWYALKKFWMELKYRFSSMYDYSKKSYMSEKWLMNNYQESDKK